jgi:hypothetical protein
MRFSLLVFLSLLFVACKPQMGTQRSTKQEFGTSYRHVEYSPEFDALRDKIADDWRVVRYDSGRVDHSTAPSSPMFKVEIKSLAMMGMPGGPEGKAGSIATNEVRTERETPTMSGTEKTVVQEGERKGAMTGGTPLVRKDYLVLDIFPRRDADQAHASLVKYFLHAPKTPRPREYSNDRYYVIIWDKNPTVARANVTTLSDSKMQQGSIEHTVVEHLKLQDAVFTLKNEAPPAQLTK